MFEVKYDVANDIKEEELVIESNLTLKLEFFVNYFCTYIAQNLIFRKSKKPMKYNLVRTIFFHSTLQIFWVFLDIYEQIKFLLSDFEKDVLY